MTANYDYAKSRYAVLTEQLAENRRRQREAGHRTELEREENAKRHDEYNRLVIERREVLDNVSVTEALRSLGALGAVGVFSGGNDEGGYDSLELVAQWKDASAEQIVRVLEEWDDPDDAPQYEAKGQLHQYWQEDTEQPSFAEIVIGRKMNMALEQWGTFAGNFSVQGTAILGPDGQGHLNYRESVEEWDSGGDSF